MKILEHILNSIICEQVHIDTMQFGFMPERGTTDAIFIQRKLQKKYISNRNNTYFAFVDLEKEFDCVPRTVLWWAMRKLVKLSTYQLDYIRDQYSATFCSSLLYRLSPMSSELGALGRCYMPMTWLSLATLDELKIKLRRWKEELE